MCFHGPLTLIQRVLPNGSQNNSLLILGLDNAGKSTLTTRLSELFNGKGKVCNDQASLWSLRINNSKLKLWDINGELKNRQIWPNYYTKARILIFVVDSKDSVRLSEARCVLCDVLMHEELSKAALLIIANKKDGQGFMPMSTIVDLMGLDQLQSREWTIKECSLLSGDGVQDIVNWILSKTKKTKK